MDYDYVVVKSVSVNYEENGSWRHCQKEGVHSIHQEEDVAMQVLRSLPETYDKDGRWGKYTTYKMHTVPRGLLEPGEVQVA